MLLSHAIALGLDGFGLCRLRVQLARAPLAMQMLPEDRWWQLIGGRVVDGAAQAPPRRLATGNGADADDDAPAAADADGDDERGEREAGEQPTSALDALLTAGRDVIDALAIAEGELRALQLRAAELETAARAKDEQIELARTKLRAHADDGRASESAAASLAERAGSLASELAVKDEQLHLLKQSIGVLEIIESIVSP